MLTPLADALTFLDYLRMPPGLIDPDVIPVTPWDKLPPDVGDAKSGVPADLKVSALPPLPPPSAPSWSQPAAYQEEHFAASAIPPLPRLVHVGCVGSDVLAFKRALVRSGIRPAGLDRRFTPRQRRTDGLRMRSEVETFQRRRGLAADGVIGPHTYASFVAAGYIDAFGYLLLRGELRHLATLVNPRALSIHHALRSVALHAYWHYAELRPYPVWELADHVPTTTDCSGGFGLWYKWAGMPSPFGPLGWSGYGNTDTMLGVGTHVAMPGPSDAILYSNPGHVILCTAWPYGVSHGSEGGPYYTDVRYRPIYDFRRY